MSKPRSRRSKVAQGQTFSIEHGGNDGKTPCVVVKDRYGFAIEISLKDNAPGWFAIRNRFDSPILIQPISYRDLEIFVHEDHGE